MIGITYGIRPYGGHPMGWTSPFVLALLGAGRLPARRVRRRSRRASRDPMFRLPLFRIRAFTFGVLSSFLVRGRPRRADVHADHLAAGHLAARSTATASRRRRSGPGIYMLPLTVGLPARRARSRASSPTATARARSRPAGCSARRSASCCSTLLPVDFAYPVFAGDPAPDGPLDGRVRLAEPRGGDEQPAGAAPRRRRRHEPDLPELRAGALDRHLLHADDRRALRARCPHTLTAGLEAHGVPARDGRRTSRTCRRSRCCSRRSSATTRSQQLIGPHVARAPVRGERRRAQRPRLLPAT